MSSRVAASLLLFPNHMTALMRKSFLATLAVLLLEYSQRIGLSGIRFFRTDDIRDGDTADPHEFKMELLKLEGCATEATDVPRHYTFGCSFGFYDQTYSGAPLQSVGFGRHEWPFDTSILGPVYNATEGQIAKDEESKRLSEGYLKRHPPTHDFEYETDPCNGQRVLAGGKE